MRDALLVLAGFAVASGVLVYVARWPRSYWWPLYSLVIFNNLLFAALYLFAR